MSYMDERIKEEINLALADIEKLSEEMAEEAVEQKNNPSIKTLTEPEFSPKLHLKLLGIGFKINLLKGLL